MSARLPVRLGATLAAAVALASCPALAADGRLDTGAEIGPFVAEAAARFGLPSRWILAVLHAESGGDARARSSAGAIGLMQIMPATWADLSARHGLGADPFDPHDNILAGAAYLRELYDRYGLAGFLAAYNAGPGRYEAYLQSGRPLPAETRAYLASLLPRVGGSGVDLPALRPPDWRAAPLFATSVTRGPAAAEVALPRLFGRRSTGPSRERSAPADTVFASLIVQKAGS